MGATADGHSALQHVPEQQQAAEDPGAAQNESFQQDQKAPASEEKKEQGQTIQVDEQQDGLKADEKVHSPKEQSDDASAPTDTPSATGSKEDGHSSKAEVPPGPPGNDGQHTQEESHVSTIENEVKPETQKHDQHQRGSPEQATDKSDRHLSPRDDKISDRDRHTHSSTLAQERSQQPSKHRSKHDSSLESPKHPSETRSKSDSSPRAPHSFSKGSSPKTHSNSRAGLRERSQADPSLPAEPNKKRAREHGTTDWPEEKHVKSDKHASSSRCNQQSPKASKSHAAASSPADDRRRGSSHSHRRAGETQSEGGSDHRKRHSEHHKHSSEKHSRKLAEDGKDRFLVPAGGQPAATETAEGSKTMGAPPAADTAGGNIAKTGKEKKVAAKVHLSFDEELDEGEDTSSLSAFNLGASTASRFQQERQKANARPAPSVAAPSVQANNLRVQADDDDDGFGQGSRGIRDKEPDPCLGRVFIGVAQAKVARPYMEDRHTIVASYLPCQSNGTTVDDGICRCFAAVYDGHNGCHAADLAASRLHLMIASDPALRMYSGSTGPPSLVAQEEAAIRTALCRAFREIDDDILKTARAESLRDGSTALVVLRLGQVLYAAHAGDSRAVLCRGGLAERLTEDHKPNRPVERHRILSIGGRVEFQRCWRVIVEPRDGRPGSALAVSRSLGDLDFKEPQRLVECEPEVGRTQLQSTDSFVVLATDGLWDMLNDQDAVDCAKAAIEAHMKSSGRGFSDAAAIAASEALLQEAIRRGTMDNTTVVVLLLQWD